MRPSRQALNRVMTIGATSDRANDHALVHDPGHALKDFADLDAIDVGLNRLKLAADLLRRFGLDVPHILMGRTTGQVDVDDRLVLGASALLCFRAEQARQRQSADRKSSMSVDASPLTIGKLTIANPDAAE